MVKFCVLHALSRTQSGHYLTSRPGLAPQILDGDIPEILFPAQCFITSAWNYVLHRQERTNAGVIAAVLLHYEDKVHSIPLVFPPKMKIHHIQWL